MGTHRVAEAKRAVACWEWHWDEERPTLFGVSQAGVRDALAAWPDDLMRDDRVAVLTLNDTPGWWLYGVRPPVRDASPEVTGIGHEDTRALFERLRPKLRAVFDRL